MLVRKTLFETVNPDTTQPKSRRYSGRVGLIKERTKCKICNKEYTDAGTIKENIRHIVTVHVMIDVQSMYIVF